MRPSDGAGADRFLREFRPAWILEVHEDGRSHTLDLLQWAGYRLRWDRKDVKVSLALPIGEPTHVVGLP
ncbi:MAG: hypothetical protein KGJ40_01525 [candidate division NC10 bacterium]|nr:hypothetical protein [candidate division NC10 bacterium]